jgi:thiol-disulfide isomerase/thioredoxin
VTTSTTLPVEGVLPEFDGAAGWINSGPLSAAALRGSVVLVDFWTYTCINWLRTLAYVRAWAEKYGDAGLVVVGVHTPEFPFERDAENVRGAVAAMRVRYPVALDPDYAVWRAFDNHYWPAVYLADAGGSIRYHHFGEGAYDESERAIQRLVRAAGAAVADDTVSIVPDGLEAQADWANLKSAETYLGYEQGRNFAVPGDVKLNVRSAYSTPDPLPLNRWALSGQWTIEGRASVANAPGGGIHYRFHARDVNLVMRSREQAAIPFRVLLDGAAPGSARGLDVDTGGSGILDEPRLYQLIRRPDPVDDHTIEIRFAETGVEAYVFTFG